MWNFSKRQKCAKCKHEYERLQIRQCPYSKLGLYVCVYCCKKCDYVKRVGTGWMCTYENKEDRINGENRII